MKGQEQSLYVFDTAGFSINGVAYFIGMDLFTSHAMFTLLALSLCIKFISRIVFQELSIAL